MQPQELALARAASQFTPGDLHYLNENGLLSTEPADSRVTVTQEGKEKPEEAAPGELQRAREKLSAAEQGSVQSVREARLAGADRQVALDGKEAAESDLYVFAAVAFSAVIAALFVVHRLMEEQRSRVALSRFLRWLSRRKGP